MRILKEYSSFAKENWLLLTTSSISIFTFILGHSAAYFYYSGWGVDYLKFAEIDSGLSFILSSPYKSLITVILFTSFIILPSIFGWFAGFVRPEIFKRKFIGTVITWVAAFMSVWLWSALFQTISSGANSTEVKERLYNPYIVWTSDEKRNLRCVYFVGSLGGFEIFANRNNNIHFLKKETIVAMEYVFSGFPTEIKKLNLLKLIAPSVNEMNNLNPLTTISLRISEYNQLKSEWEAEWDLSCKNNDGFTHFDFKQFN